MPNNLAANTMAGENSLQAGILLHGPPGSMGMILLCVASFSSHICFSGLFAILCDICLMLKAVTANSFREKPLPPTLRPTMDRVSLQALGHARWQCFAPVNWHKRQHTADT